MAIVQFSDGLKIEFSGNPTEKDIKDAYNQAKGIRNPAPSTLANPVKANEPNYFQRVGQDFTNAGNEIVSEIKKASTPTSSVLGDAKQLGETVLRGVGSIAGAAFSPVLQAPIIKPLTEKAGELIGKIPGVEQTVKVAQDLSKKYPNASKDLEAIVNIVSLGGGKVATAPLLKEGKAVTGDVIRAVDTVLTPSEKAIQSNIQELFQKSIKPTAKKTISQGEKYANDTLEALKTIKKNSDSLNFQDVTGEIVTGRTPQTIEELAQAVDQTKKTVFNQYDSLAKKANRAGAGIDAKPIAEDVIKVSQNKALQITNPEVVKYAENWAERLKGLNLLDTETTQAVIQNLNSNLQAFYRNPTYESASKAAIDAGIVNNFRKALDKAIEGATGEQYQALKNQYASLKTIENDVTRAAMREGRKNVKGLLDYSDIFTGGQMISGILSLNPAMFTKGAIERGFKEYFKYLNDPNRAIKNIFDNLDIAPSSAFSPKSKTIKVLSKPFSNN